MSSDAGSALSAKARETKKVRGEDQTRLPAQEEVAFTNASGPIYGETGVTLRYRAIDLYGLRFKIDLSFKQALRVVGTFAYHFWMAAMTPARRKSGNQHLPRLRIWFGDLSAPECVPYDPEWHPPNWSPPSRSAIPFLNVSRMTITSQILRNSCLRESTCKELRA
jgi:hypothetical protein